MTKIRGLMLGVAVLLAPITTQAAPIITNGSFETGDLTGWSGTATTDGEGLNPFGTTFGSGMDGTYWMWLAGYEIDRTLEQTITGLSAGSTYRLSFIMASEATNSDQLNLSIDGGSQTLFTAPPYGGGFWDTWVEKTYDFVAATTSATIQFSSVGLNEGGYDVGLDNVRIEALNNNVPEPASLALLGIGLAGFGFSRRKRAS